MRIINFEWNQSEVIPLLGEKNLYNFAIFTSNEKFKETLVAINSIKKNYKKKAEIIIIINKIEDNNLKRLNKYFKSLFITIINLYKIKNEYHTSTIWPEIISKRFILLHRCFKSYNYILSIENDVILTKKSKNIFNNLNIKQWMMCSCDSASILNINFKLKDEYKKNTIANDYNELYFQDYLKKIKVDLSDYYNAGVILFFPKNISCDNNYIKKLFYLTSQYIFLDQDVLNVKLKSHIQTMEIKYNFSPKYFSKISKDFAIIHFVGRPKPWEKKILLDVNRTYFYWFNNSIKFYFFLRENIYFYLTFIFWYFAKITIYKIYKKILMKIK